MQTQLADGATLYNEVLILERTGRLDREALERSFSEVTRRHTTLRTAFTAVEGTPIQRIAEHHAAAVPLTELTALPEQQRNAEVLRMAMEEVRHPFDLAKGPLVRARLLQLSQENYALVVTLHNIAADDWSLNILARELCELYQAYSAGKPSPLSDLPIEYADFAHWQRHWFEGTVLEQHISYWRKRLSGMPAVLDLPTDRPRPAVQGFRGARQSLMLSKSLSESLKKLSARERVTPVVTFLAAFQTLLARYTRQYDIAVGSILPGRERVGTEGLIGLFAHTVMIRTDLEGDPTFRELLCRLRDAAPGDCEHQNLPLDHLIRELQPGSDPSGNPLIRVLFSFTPSISLVQWGWKMANLEVDDGTSKVDLQLQLYDRPDGIVARFTYDTELFDAATISRMAGHFQMLLQGIVADPDQSISRLPLLTSAERHQLLVGWNDTHQDYPKDSCVHQFFEEQVSRTPEATAVVSEQDRLSYRELNARANQLAHHLRKRGVGPEVLVGVCTQRSVEMLIGILGILKAGGAYVPLDPAYPNDRLAAILEDSKAPILLTQQPLPNSLPQHAAEVIRLDADWQKIAAESQENPVSDVKPENLAYVLFTSGSTGRPKGVSLEHRSAATFIHWAQSVFTPQEVAGTLFSTSMCFDLSVFEMFVPLSMGGKVIMVQNALFLPELPAASEVTLINTVPSAIAELVQMNAVPPSVQVVNLAGEALPPPMVQQIYAKTRAQKVYNLYGPTEDTTYSTYTLVKRGAQVTIGRPLSNTQAHILDANRQLVPIGVPGELYLAGDGLARGYFGRPDLTNERFLPNPFSPEPDARMYRTGDLARFLPCGNIQFLGRIDNQVKVRGFRIELGEIEATLMQHPAVKTAVAHVREEPPGEKYIAAYVVSNSGPAPTADELRLFMKSKLPDYMLPSRFAFLEALPLTPNGKVDRKALPAPTQLGFTQQKESVAPRNATESRLVKIWESVLSVRPVGVKENFFELGGHSLLVAKLLRRIEQAFGNRLSMAAIFKAPTIEQQASMLSKGTALLRHSAVVPIQPAGSKPPFFCFGFNTGPLFLPLARRLGSDQPLLGVDPMMLQDSELTSPLSMESIAASLVKRIRELQPEGPYYLGGFCTGGLVAYEAARQLTALGQQVALLALCEPQTPVRYNRRSIGSRVHSLGQRLTFHLHNLQHKERRVHVQDRARAFFDRLETLLLRIFHNMRSPRNDGKPRDLGDIVDVSLICRDYQPQPFPGRITLFQAADRPSERGRDSQYWRNLSASLDVHEIPGYWNWIVRSFLEPNVEILANKLNERLG
jgi:aspartate racemase